MKKKRKKIDLDPRIKKKLNYLNTFLIVFSILVALAFMHVLIYNQYTGIEHIPLSYVFSMIVFWGIVALLFISIFFYQKKYYYDTPMQKLSQATKKVAEGNFSAYIEPFHKKEKFNYVGVMYEDFNKMVEVLGSNQTLKNDIVGNASHELKAPLSVIQSYATALQKENLSPDYSQDYIETIVEASKNLDTLITNILQLNKLENQEVILDIEEIDFSRHLTEAILKYEKIIEQKNIDLEIEIEDDIYISSNTTMLDIVWNNILSNAIKFTDPNGKIYIKQTSNQKRVSVQIVDNGCGMSQETLSLLYDKFYQGEPSRSSEGNGLGMTMVLRIINLLNGSITVHSKLGEGTKITVELSRL